MLNEAPLNQSTNVSELQSSQTEDPDYIVTDSELLSINLTEESEELFLPNRRSKRQRSSKVENKLPKRILRRKKN